ncbi:MAG: hypothetical protein NDI90_15250 [Nitrospira sp. BO4]|jgi:hypothetical protein|nr:hypothetical protein [Nitrospira sp. BO4]
MPLLENHLVQAKAVRGFQEAAAWGLDLAVWDRVEVWVHLAVREAAVSRRIHGIVLKAVEEIYS